MNPTVTITRELLPFTIPQGVSVLHPPQPRQNGFKPFDVFQLCDLTPEALATLCDNFRVGVFAAAGKEDPNIIKEAQRKLSDNIENIKKMAAIKYGIGQRT